MDKKVLLMILDGWGIATNPAVSAIDKAKTPFVDSLYTKYPHARLEASGLAVGLPEGQMGNSEVGHMNIGAGRVVYQDLVKINQAVKNGELNTHPVLAEAFANVKSNKKKPILSVSSRMVVYMLILIISRGFVMRLSIMGFRIRYLFMHLPMVEIPIPKAE